MLTKGSWAAKGPILWLLWQWAMPLRMPIISNGEFTYTMEGYVPCLHVCMPACSTFLLNLCALGPRVQRWQTYMWVVFYAACPKTGGST